MEDLLESFPIQIAEPGQTYYLSENFLWPLWTYWKVSRPGSQGPAGLITYQKTFLGHTGLIEKFPVPAPGARPDLLLIRKLSLAVLDLAPISAPLLAPVEAPFLDPNRTTQKGSFVEEYVYFQDLGRPNWEPILDPFRTHFRVLFGIISGPLWYLLKSFPTRLAELPDLLLIRKLFLAILDLLESFSARLAEPGWTYYLSEKLSWPFWTY